MEKNEKCIFLEKIGSRINKIIGNLVHNPKSRTYLPMQHHKYFVLPQPFLNITWKHDHSPQIFFFTFAKKKKKNLQKISAPPQIFLSSPPPLSLLFVPFALLVIPTSTL